MISYCRTCMQEIKDTSCLVLQNWDKVKFELSFCIPELEIDLVLNPALCILCFNALQMFFNFKNLCLANEQHIYSNMQYMRISSNTATLAEVLARLKMPRVLVVPPQTANIQEPQVAIENEPEVQSVILDAEDDEAQVIETQTVIPASEELNEVIDSLNTNTPSKNSESVLDNNQNFEAETENHTELLEEIPINNIDSLNTNTPNKNSESVLDNDKNFEAETDNHTELFEEIPINNENYHADIINNIETITKNDNVQFVELYEEPVVSEMSYYVNDEPVQIENMEYEPVLKSYAVSATPKPIKFNLLGKRKTKYTCDLCEYSTFEHDQFLLHGRNMHCTDEKVSDELPMAVTNCKYTCGLCNSSFITKDILANHMNINHNIKKIFSCISCDYVCHNEVYLLNHMAGHSLAGETDVIMID